MVALNHLPVDLEEQRLAVRGPEEVLCGIRPRVPGQAPSGPTQRGRGLEAPIREHETVDPRGSTDMQRGSGGVGVDTHAPGGADDELTGTGGGEIGVHTASGPDKASRVARVHDPAETRGKPVGSVHFVLVATRDNAVRVVGEVAGTAGDGDVGGLRRVPVPPTDGRPPAIRLVVVPASHGGVGTVAGIPVRGPGPVAGTSRDRGEVGTRLVEERLARMPIPATGDGGSHDARLGKVVRSPKDVDPAQAQQVIHHRFQTQGAQAVDPDLHRLIVGRAQVFGRGIGNHVPTQMPRRGIDPRVVEQARIAIGDIRVGGGWDPARTGKRRLLIGGGIVGVVVGGIIEGELRLRDPRAGRDIVVGECFLGDHSAIDSAGRHVQGRGRSCRVGDSQRPVRVLDRTHPLHRLRHHWR